MGQEQSADDQQSEQQDPQTGNRVDDESDAHDGAPVFIEDDTDVDGLSAYRVMKVFHGSPSSRSGLKPFEDFILAVNGTLVESDKSSLANVLLANEGKEVALVVYNVVDARRRDVALRPVKWNGPGLLGAAVRYEPIAGAMEHVLRVVDVLPDSPAAEAGLVSTSDYIVGTPAEVFRTDTEFTKLITHALERDAPASFMVYSTQSGKTRDVELRPNADWGGEGTLGCELATGLLHRITRPSS